MNNSKTNEYENQNIVAFVKPFAINTIENYQPGIIAWWSAAFPGFGHIILGHYLIGFIFIIHEIIMNTLSGLNTAIYHSMIGDFEMAKQILNKKWVIAYISPYIFAIWDSYQRSVQLNSDYRIAMKRGYAIISKDFSIFGLNRHCHKKPILSVLWTVIAPGSGHIYINRLLVIFLLPIFVLIVHFSHFIQGIYQTMIGDFEQAKQTMNPQWLLYLPSIYCFISYDVFVQTLSNNRLYQMTQKRFLEKNYQNQHFPLGEFFLLKENTKK